MAQNNNNNNEPIVGIDLGTTFSVIGIYNENTKQVQFFPEGNSENCLVPSKIFFTGEKLLVGTIAARTIVQPKYNKPEMRKNYFYDIKRIIGRRFNDEKIKTDLANFTFNTYPADPNDLSSGVLVEFQESPQHERSKVPPEVLSGILLKHLRSMGNKVLGVEVKKCVITVPAHFSNNERTSTCAAAKLAGLDPIHIINEPTAAAISYSFYNLRKDIQKDLVRLLVFDLGGGTFDVSVVSYRKSDNSYIVSCSGGDLHLGGRDFDKNLEDVLARKIKDLQPDLSDEFIKNFVSIHSETIKKQLSIETETNFYANSPSGELDFEVTRQEFEEANEHLFQQCINIISKILDEKNIDINSIDDVVAVGGSSRIPRIQALLESFFQKKPNVSVNQDLAIAHGAATLAFSLSLGEKFKFGDDIIGAPVNPARVCDITNFGLGVVTEGKNLDTILPKFTLVPQTCTQRYYTYPYSPAVRVQLYQIQEESQLTHPDNKKLDEKLITGWQTTPKQLPIDVTISIDEQNMITCTAVNADNEKCVISMNVETKNTTIITQVDEEIWKQRIEALSIAPR